MEDNDSHRGRVHPAFFDACVSEGVCALTPLWAFVNRSKRENMIKCRNLIGCEKYLSALKNMASDEMLEHLYGIDIHACPECGKI